MKPINVMLSNLDGKVIPIGYEGENMYTRVRINCVEIFTEYPDATVSMVISPPTGSMYPAVIEKSGVMVVWDITKSILSSNGSGSAQLTFKDGETEIKSVIFGLSINRSLIADGEPPEPVQEWIDRAEETAEEIATRAAENVVENWDQMVSDVADLKEDVERIDATINAQGIFVETESLPIVSISDGADNQPMKAVKVAIEPVQDLHGYDSPWPAGGGINQFGDYTILNAYIASDGKITSNSDNRSYIIPINPSTTYAFKVIRTTASGSTANDDFQIGEYYLDSRPVIGETGARLYAGGYVNNVVAGMITTSENAKWLAVKIGKVNVTDVDATARTAQIEVGSTVSETYTPYSNICPISGWTGAKVTRCGKNLLPNTMVQDTSTRVRLGESTVGDGIRLKAGTYRISYAYKDGTVPLTPYWRTVKDGVAGSINNAWVIAIDEDINVRIWLYNSQGVSVDNVEWAMVELGSTATTYEPYQGQIYEVTFPSEAGTVYGGTLDVVSGKLVVDRVMYLTPGWTKYAESNGFNAYKAPNLKRANGSYTEAVAPMSNAVGKYGTFQSSNMTENIIQPPIGLTTIGYMALKDGIDPQNISLSYLIPPEQPIILTPTEIKTLLGENRLWSDCGDSSITYPADTKMYIDKKIAELQALILENNS